MTSPPHAPSTGPSRVDVLLRAIVRSGLFDVPRLQKAVASAPSAIRGDADALADHLVKTGHLSRFQAHKLLQGVSYGLVLGAYHLLAQIGRGGMGAVYLARDTRNQALAAIKVLPPKRARAQERLLARFRREMEICQRVDHPHMARTYEVGTHQDVHYIVMEYIPGKNLFRLVHERGPLEVGRAAQLFREVADGLDHAHGQGLIHRDLKPSNILITPDDHAKVLDLGLALIQSEVAEERTIVGGQGYVVGTMDYLAPEQAEDPLSVDPRSDLYSLGATLYFTMTGQPPFPGGTLLEKMLRHRTEEPAPVESLRPGMPAGFAAIIRRLMAKDAKQRFASAVELRAALASWAVQPQPMPALVVAPAPVPAPVVPILARTEAMVIPVVMSRPVLAAPIESEPPGDRTIPMPIVPIALPVDGPDQPPIERSPLGDALFAHGGTHTMKLSRAVLAAEGIVLVDEPAAAVPVAIQFEDSVQVSGVVPVDVPMPAAAPPFGWDFMVPVAGAMGVVAATWALVLAWLRLG